MRKLSKLYVEITNVCNLRCSFCPAGARKPEFVSVERFRQLLGKIRGAAGLLYFHLKGEPLLHPDLGVLIGLAGDAGFSVALTTNGRLLAERLGELAGRPALRRVNVSLHSLEDGAADADALDRILDAAAALRDSDRERRTLEVVSLRLWNRGDQAASAFLRGRIERRFGLREGGLAAALERERGAQVAPGLSVHPAERFEWPRRDGPDRGARGFCRALRDQAGILADGTVVPCCLDGEGELALGNVYETEWADLIGSPRARALRDGFSARRVVEPFCRTCGYRARFDAP